jgi:uncharacterized membrane protein YhhN
MTIILFGLAVLCALIEWFAVSRGWRKLEYAAKPGVMVFLLVWLLLNGGAHGPLAWFTLAGALSLTGDVFLLLTNERRWFMFGLGSFLLAHLAYILGLNTPPAPLGPTTIGLSIIVMACALPLVRRILMSVKKKGLPRLVEPVRVYATVISLMLFTALMTLFRTDWLPVPAYLVSLGAFLFITSDLLLAWNKFVNPIRRGRLLLMVTYHLGQMALIAGAVGQFGNPPAG